MAVTESIDGTSSHVVARIPKRGPGTNDSEGATEHVVARREELLMEKRRELAKLLDDHDTAVRICSHRVTTLMRPFADMDNGTGA